jgi:hypothetical protein
MSRRLLAAVALLALATPFTMAQEAPARLPLRDSIALMAPRLDFEHLFARMGEGTIAETEDGVRSTSISSEMVLARIGADGKVVMACVDNPAAAERFFQAPVERVGQRKAHNQ